MSEEECRWPEGRLGNNLNWHFKFQFLRYFYSIDKSFPFCWCPLSNRTLYILGTRGIPAAHGGFETFAEHFAKFMVSEGWQVIVYCQGEGGVRGGKSIQDEWNGVTRIRFETRAKGPLATIEFDLRCVLHSLRTPGAILVLGYNTAIFNLVYLLFRRSVAMNMDGIEWKRAKWGKLAKAWFWLNEWLGARTCTIPIADHPEIAAHLARRGCKRAVVIPYGAEPIASATEVPLFSLGLVSREYFMTIARIERENSILEIVSAFAEARTTHKLAVIGKFEPLTNQYHAAIKEAAGENVVFLGPIYDKSILQSLRFHSIAYIHGHQVGGTNPSLVEALAAGNAVIAHDNAFNRWTAGESQHYFTNVEECAGAISALSTISQTELLKLQQLSRELHSARYTFRDVHAAYAELIESIVFGNDKDQKSGVRRPHLDGEASGLSNVSS